MSPDAKKGDLLYIATAGNNDVEVYSYPKAKLVGTLTNLNWPEGECVDKDGNIWITNFGISGAGDVVEYAHGGTTPVATLSDPYQHPLGCSVDPTTGDLAVTSTYGTSSPGQGDVAIYKKARGTPKTYTDQEIFYYYFCGFDSSGNLFIDGISSGSAVEFAELSKSSKTFTNLTLNKSIAHPGGVQWDGKYVAFGDQWNPIIYEFAISGSNGEEVSSTPLDGASGVAQFFIDDNTVIGPNVSNDLVGFWRYPAGGTATKTLTGLDEPVGTAISTAK